MIIGVLGVLIIPQFHSMVSETKLNEATGELVSGLQYAGNLAIKYQRSFGLEANDAENWFRVFDYRYKDDTNPHHHDCWPDPACDPPVDAYGVVINPVDKKWYIKDFDTMKTYEGVHITSVPGGGENVEIHFYPDGHSSCPADPDNTFVLSLGDDKIAIAIDRITGRISVD